MFIYYTILVILLIVYVTLKNMRSSSNSSSSGIPNINFSNYYYKKKYIFSKNELNFYYQLNNIITKYNLMVFSKIRLADLIEIKRTREKTKYFNKIKSKHIDYVILKHNGEILLCIELDDITHFRDNRKNRDIFINKLFYDLALPLYRYNINNYYGFEKLENFIKNSVNVENETKEIVE